MSDYISPAAHNFAAEIRAKGILKDKGSRHIYDIGRASSLLLESRSTEFVVSLLSSKSGMNRSQATMFLEVANRYFK